LSNPPSFSDMHSQESSPIDFEMLTPPKAEDPPPVREGLPPTFRMRADSHYVDSLDSTPLTWRVESIAITKIEPRDRSGGQPVPELVDSIRRHGVLQPLIVQSRVGPTRLLAGQKRLDAAIAAGLREVPCIVRDVDDELAGEVTAAANVFSRVTAGGSRDRSNDPTMTAASVEAGGELARSITMLGTSATLLEALPSDLTRRVTTSLMRAEIWRATCLLQALRILRAEVDVRRTCLEVQPLVARVLHAVEAERALRGIQLNRDVTLSHGTVLGDHELLACVLSGLVVATFELVGGADVQATVAAGVGPGGFFKFSIAQDSVAAPPAWLAVVREELVRDRSIGFGAIAIAAARRLVEGGGGRVTLAESVRGTEIHVTIPGVA
jgi:ParB/RepB/Spo0J family partition protein